MSPVKDRAAKVVSLQIKSLPKNRLLDKMDKITAVFFSGLHAKGFTKYVYFLIIYFFYLC